jgi:hypothetical protein
VLLGGPLLDRLAGWWWADPVAAFAMVWWISGEIREAVEAAMTVSLTGPRRSHGRQTISNPAKLPHAGYNRR